MALERLNISPTSFDASQNHKILIPLNSDHYMMQINYAGFVPGAGTAFKLHRIASTNPKESDLIEIAESEQIIADANGNVIYSNELPEKADFLCLEYTADGNDPASTFTVNISSRSW